MAQITLRPDLKTAGGEVCDILVNQRYVGSLTLLYRESDRMAGSVQLDESSLSEETKEEVILFIQNHIQALVDALDLEECDVVVTYSPYDLVISSDDHDAFADRIVDAEDELYLDDANNDYQWAGDEASFNDVDPESWETSEADLDAVDEAEYYDLSDDLLEGNEYELVIIDEARNRVDYHVYDQDQEFVAEIFAKIYGRDLICTVNWMFEPDEDEIDLVADLLMQDFDEDEIDTAVIHMSFEGKLVETIELTHEDLLDEADDEMYMDSEDMDEEEYSVMLTRDDGDTLTYEIYQDSYGELPIGTATVDISQRQLTGFIDFREPGSADDREFIVSMLMQELDKEKDYDGLNMSMMYNDELIDEIFVEMEQVH